MSTPDQIPTETPSAPPPISQSAPARTRAVQRCNFRMAGRLSNEDARALTAMHETTAQHIGESFDAYLGAAVEVKFVAIAQLAARDHVEEIAPLCYIMPLSSGMAFVEFDLDLVFPMIELLMGGAGNAKSSDRDLSELEDEMMQDVVLLVMREANASWALPDLSLAPNPRIRPAMMLQSFRPSEKVTVLRFEMAFADAGGSFNIALSTPLCDLLTKKIKQDQPRTKPGIWSFPAPPLRERILECEMEVVAELTELKVAVKDLVALQPGSVLKLRAPIRLPGVLTAGGRGLFEAVPVRSGSQRAVQLGRKTHLADWKRR